VLFLKEKKADPNIQDFQGDSAVHHLASQTVAGFILRKQAEFLKLDYHYVMEKNEKA